MPVRRPLGRLVTALAATTAVTAGGVVLALPATAKDALPPVTGSVVVTGNGFGHGHGMSQWGAEGAARAGHDYRAISSFYYPGTSWGTASGKVRVLITADTSRAVVVKARSGLKARRVGHGDAWKIGHAKPHAKKWRIKPAAGGRSMLQFKTAGWHRYKTVAGDLEFAGGGPISLVLPHHQVVAYRGTLRAASPHPGGMDRDTVNVVSLENYLKGVVPSEMPASWHAAAVQTQAVAARTYAVFERADQNGYYQLCDTAACQVYGGYSAEQAASNTAISATAHQILTYGGQPAYTQFSASNGGAMLSGGEPYLVSKTDPFDKAVSPYIGWRTSVSAASIEDRWPGIGQLTDMSVTTSSANAPGAGYVATVLITGTKGSKTVSGDTFRSFAGLRSSWFVTQIPASARKHR